MAISRVNDFKSIFIVRWNILELINHKEWTKVMQIKQPYYTNVFREFYGDDSSMRTRHASKHLLGGDKHGNHHLHISTRLQRYLMLMMSFFFTKTWYDEVKVDKKELISQMSKDKRVEMHLLQLSIHAKDTSQFMHPFHLS